MIPCDKCRSRAVIFQRYSGLHLCEDHLEDDIYRKMRESLRKYKILGGGGTIAVAMSGGKDSSVLLYLLKRLFEKRPDIRIVALLVNEGIAGYRERTLLDARSLADSMGIEHMTVSFEDAFGFTTDMAAALNMESAPCSFCGVMRKILLNKTAREMNAMALATGHNLDDEVQTIMMNYLRGDASRLFRLYPRSPKEGMVPRIKPLRKVPEKEVATLAILRGLFPPRHGSCPNVPRSMRLEIKGILNDLEARHPGTKYSIMRGYEKLMEMQPASKADMKWCAVCGEPTGGEICMSCKMLEDLKSKAFLALGKKVPSGPR
jgi:uncharacterized protein (TIGR00269 family)